MTTITGRSRAHFSLGHLLLRVLLTIGLIVPATLLFTAVRSDIDDRRATAARELLGVQYLQALEPLAAGLAVAQTAAVNGGSQAVHEISSTLQGRINAVAAVDTQIGGELGVRERWANLRGAIEALPTRAEPRVLYGAYHDVMELELALVDRIAQVSRLAVDPDADTFYLNRAVTRDLPELNVATGRLADLATLSQLSTPTTADIASLLELQEDAGASAARLVESTEAAATATTDSSMISRVFAPLDKVRGDLDRLAKAGSTISDGTVSGVDVGIMSTLRENLATAASALATSIYAELNSLLTQRRDSDDRNRLYGVLSLVVIIALALVPTVTAAREYLRQQRDHRARERLDTADPIGPGLQWTSAPAAPERERAGAAR